MKTDNVKVAPRWKRTKEEVWAGKFEALEDRPVAKTAVLKRRLPVVRMAVAAVVAVVLLLPAVAFFYTKGVTAERGEHVSVVLPDGSKARLNAGSSIGYKPLWWVLSRKVNMDGEVYFEVESGKKFSVESRSGTVSVLGTTFNIYDRDGDYTVGCLGGKVAVEMGEQSVVLTPGMSVVNDNGSLVPADDPAESIGWISGKFVFNSVPLAKVIAEIERQYDIKVAAPAGLDYLYTGQFSKSQDPEQVLLIVGKPFGINLKIE